MINKKLIILVIFFGIVLTAFVSSFQGSSTSYSSDNKIDSFSYDNSSSISYSQRTVGGIGLVGEYIVGAIRGRFGILGGTTDYDIEINLTSPLNNSILIRGSDSVGGEDDKGVVPNIEILVARVYDSSTNSGIEQVRCNFYENSVLIGTNETNNSGHCILNYDKTTKDVGYKNFSVNYTVLFSDPYTRVTNFSSANSQLEKYSTILTALNTRDNGKYYDGDTAVLEIDISKINVSGIFSYDPQNISANATSSAENNFPEGEVYYPGNITRISEGVYQANVSVNYSFATFVRWDVVLSDDGFGSFIGSAVHADKEICSANFGVWSSWSACTGGTQTRTRTDSSGCVETETRSCSVESCFPAGTKITLPNKSVKNIEDIEVGDYVLSYQKGEFVKSKVLEVENPVRDHLCELSFEDGSKLDMTKEHPVYTSEGWKSISPVQTFKENPDLNVDELTKGDEVLTQNSFYKKIDSINCWGENIQTYNLKKIENTYSFFADGFLAHNKGGCIPQWSEWSEWSECIDGNKSRIRTDGCGHNETEFAPCNFEICDDGIDNDGDGKIDCDDEDCFESPYCKEIPNELGGRASEWVCGEWGECELDYSLQDILRGNPTLEGEQSRVCEHAFRNTSVQYRSCKISTPIKAKKVNWCYEEYIELYNVETGNLVSRIKGDSLRENRKLDIGFIVTEFEGYCDYCFDGVKNYDEEGVDCGGSCPECEIREDYIDYCYYLLWLLWWILLLLLMYLIYKWIKESREKEQKKFKRKEVEMKKPLLVRIVESLRNAGKKVRLPSIVLRTKKPKKKYKKKKSKVGFKEKAVVPYSSLRRKLRDWKNKRYYDTAPLERSLGGLIRRKLAERKKKKQYLGRLKKSNKIKKRKERQIKRQTKIKAREEKIKQKKKKKVLVAGEKLKRKTEKKNKRYAKKESKKIHKRIKKNKVRQEEISDLRKQLKDWKAKGYYDTTEIQKRLDELEGKKPWK